MTIKASYLSTEYIGKPSSYHKYTHTNGVDSITYDGLGEAPVLERGEAEVSDLDAARRARDEDVVALQISADIDELIKYVYVVVREIKMFVFVVGLKRESRKINLQKMRHYVSCTR